MGLQWTGEEGMELQCAALYPYMQRGAMEHCACSILPALALSSADPYPSITTEHVLLSNHSRALPHLPV